MALGHQSDQTGWEVRLLPASYVKPYFKRGKTDAADAEAICEAVTRPTMRFVPIKTAEQQAVLMLHRTRDLLVRQRTMLVNALRGHMAELGVIAPQGISRVADLVAVLLGENETTLLKLARGFLGNCQRARKLARCRELLGMSTPGPADPPVDYRDRFEALTGRSLRECPHCRTGVMVVIESIARLAVCQAVPDTS